MEKIVYLEENSNFTPNFIKILYKILKENKFENLIKWDEEGENIVIREINKFAENVIPIYFRHKKLSSFIRQLNLYGFKKINNDKNIYIFNCKFFKKNIPELLKYIKRKPVLKSLSYEKLNQKSIKELKNELLQIKEIMKENKDKIDSMTEKNKLLIEDNKSLLFEIINTKKDIEITMENIFKYIYYNFKDNKKDDKKNEVFKVNQNIFQLESNN